MQPRDLVPASNGRNDEAAIRLLLEACEKYGVDPTRKQRPKELAAWAFYPANEEDDVPIPDSVVIVTFGGVKIRHFADPDYVARFATEKAMDPETEERLRHVFNAFRTETYGAYGGSRVERTVPVPLPADLTLSDHHRTGVVRRTEAGR
jgi:hypothetical protein